MPDLDKNSLGGEGEFFYSCIDPRGKRERGAIKAENEGKALELLNRKGYLVLNLKKKKVRPFRLEFLSRGKEKKLLFFSRQLGTLLEGGLPLDRSLGLLAGQTGNKKNKSVLMDLKSRVLQGKSLFSGVSEHPRFFPRYFCHMVKMGEETGLMPQILYNLADHLERKLNFKKEIREALRYPIFVLAVAIGVKGFLLFQVLPFFSSLYLDFGQELPLLTQRLIGFNYFLKEFIPFFIPLLFVLFLTFPLLIKQKIIRSWVDRKKANFLPVRKIFFSSLGNNLSLMLKTGLTIDRGLEIVRGQTGNLFFSQQLGKIKKEIEEGNLISSSIEKNLGGEPFFICMLRIGEETGTLGKMAFQAGQYYQREIENWLKSIVSFIEPLLILLIAAFVGFIMVAMLLPMLEMVQVW